MGFERFDAIVPEHLGLRIDAERQEDVGAVNIGVEQTDLVSQLGQNDCQIDCERGLPYAAFAGTDGDNCIHAGRGLRRWWWLSGTRGKLRTNTRIIRDKRKELSDVNSQLLVLSLWSLDD